MKLPLGNFFCLIFEFCSFFGGFQDDFWGLGCSALVHLESSSLVVAEDEILIWIWDAFGCTVLVVTWSLLWWLLRISIKGITVILFWTTLGDFAPIFIL